MTVFNELIINERSTADFSFDVYITENAGFIYPKKKNQLIETLYGTGATKNEINAYPPIVKPYTIYCPFATLVEMREIKRWAKDSGKLISSDEPDVFYEILDVTMEDTPIDRVTGYRVNVTFTTQPFGYEHNQPVNTYTSGEFIINDTTAPMHPRIDVYGTSANEQTITIGEQEIRLKQLNEKITIESKPMEQNVYDKNGNELNSVMYGDFFEILEDTENEITLSDGIERIEILERWAWR